MGKVYGLFFGNHNYSTTLIVDGKIQYAIEDERITRIKSTYSWYEGPYTSLSVIEEKSGISLEDADKICICDPTLLFMTKNNNSFVKDLEKNKNFISRISKLKNKIEWVEHHESHAYSTYFVSGIKDKSIIVTSDGGSYEKLCGSIWLGDNNNLKKVHSVESFSNGSIGIMWYDICHFFNMIGNKDEGKIMGMAGHGEYNEYVYNSFKNITKYEGNLKFSNAYNAEIAIYIYKNLENEGWFNGEKNKKIVAYNLQKYTEDIFMEYLNDISKKYPEYRNLCLAGGLFANVKLNQVINESGLFDNVFITPPMGDEGLSFGSAIKGSISIGDWDGVRKLENAFLGLEYTDEEIFNISKSYNNINHEDFNYYKIAQLINEGNIVALLNGKFEFGPRALGARSVMVRPTERKTHEVLNTRLERNEIMPFAPFVMSEYAHIIFDIKQSEYTSEFMTMCYTVKDEWKDKLPAVIHEVDNTGRPQIVYKHKNPVFWNILNEYNKISGIPVMLNTSFNGHGEPIINTPKQSFQHLLKGTIDYLVAGDKIYKLENHE